jgi:hypothetical protein
MRNFLSILFILILLSQSSIAQIKADINDEVRANSKGSFPCLVMNFSATSSDEVKDAWKSFIKEYKGKTDYENKTKEFITDDATIKDMSENSVDVIARIENKGEKGSEMSVWFNLGVTYVSKKDFPKQYDVAVKLLEKFTKKLSADLLEEELKEEEKALRKLESDLKDLVRDESNLKSDIEKYKDTIKKMEENIKKAEEDIKQKVDEQGKKKGEIDTQKKKVGEVESNLKSMKGK